MSTTKTYVGRFAPSPTGPLHFGSLVAALASFLDARANNGQWLLRIEDLDPPRESASAPAEILNQLKTFHLDWDGTPLYQSSRLDAYTKALEQLKDTDNLFKCICTRKSTPAVYPGTCRSKNIQFTPNATRLLTSDTNVEIVDLIQGKQTWNLLYDIGDFILKRKDGLFAYQLAVVVDDEFQGITHIIRGSDLLDSTPKQICLVERLKFSALRYAHFPVILGDDGHKLSKQAHAPSISNEDPMSLINMALSALGQPIQPRSSVANMVQKAIMSWRLDRIPTSMQITFAKIAKQD